MEPRTNYRHISCKLLNCDSKLMNDKNTLRLYTREFCKELKIGNISNSHFLYNPNGFTIVVLLKQGQITLKSNNQNNTITIDIFTSSSTVNTYTALNYFKKVLNTIKCEVVENIYSEPNECDNCVTVPANAFSGNRSYYHKNSLIITILGCAGGVARSILSILNRAILDKNDPINKQISICKLHLIDSTQKEKIYYDKNFPNLKDKIKLHEFNLNKLSKFEEHLRTSKTDIVIDVSFADTVDTLRCCDELGVIYINSALESISVDKNKNFAGFSLQNKYQIFESHREEFQNTTSILCSGMNPGIVQWMANELIKKAPNSPPKACYIFEDDSSFFEDESLAKKNTIYTTKSPESFLDEAIYSCTPYLKNNESFFLDKKTYEVDFKVTLGSKLFYGCLLPHKEATTLSNIYNIETAFISKINDHTTNLIKENLDDAAILWTKPMKILDPETTPLKGESSVGILLVYDDKETFMYSSLNNNYIYKKYKTNAPYLQVACGIYGALATILLDNIPRGVYYVDQLLSDTESNYGKYLTYHLGPCIVGENEGTDGYLVNRIRELT